MPATSRDLRHHEQPAVAVDLVLLTVRDGELCVLLGRREDAKAAGGEWALPGGIVRMDESPEDTADRVLKTKVGRVDAYVEQLRTFGDVRRDPRGRVITIAYYALTPLERIGPVAKAAKGLELLTIQLMEREGRIARPGFRSCRNHRGGGRTPARQAGLYCGRSRAFADAFHPSRPAGNP